MSLSEKVGNAVRQSSQRGGVATVIGDETTIEGRVLSQGNLRIDGQVSGEVHAEDTVVLGPGGRVKGNIEARTVIIGGHIEGNVRASEKLELQPQGTVQGDIYTPYGRLVIEEGARIEGKCAMTKDVKLSKVPEGPRVVDASTPATQDESKKAQSSK